MARKTFLCVLLLLLLPVMGFSDLTITVKTDARWGKAPTSNIARLCANVALHFQEQLREEHRINGKLTIVYRNPPLAYYRSFFGGDPDEYQIGLAISTTFWDKLAYQFGHEFCHIMQNHDALHIANPDNENYWFHEAICELANVWVLLQMGETWEKRPPYSNWVSYRHNLTNYARNLLAKPETQYTGSGADWLSEWEDNLRKGYRAGFFTYARVSQLSYKFLPIFEEDPEAWNAVRQMPASSAKMSVYMQEWYNAVDTPDKAFVQSIAEIMGIQIDEMMASSDIDADVNNDGYVDLYDVMIVKSGMQNEVSYDTDINNDGITNEIDLLIVKAKAVEAIIAASPRKKRVAITTWGRLKKR